MARKPPMLNYLAIAPLPAKFDRIYKAGDRRSDAVHQVNLARLECSCPDWTTHRAGFPADDVRRVCEHHIYDKLYSTKAEKEFDPLLQLFIRYGRTMLTYRIVSDDLGVMVVGQPFGAGSIRAIGVLHGKPVLATYELPHGEWASGETDLPDDLAKSILQRMRATWPEAFAGRA